MLNGFSDDATKLLLPNVYFVGHLAYLSVLMVEAYHTHPVLRTFVQLLNQTRTKRVEDDTAGLICSIFFFKRLFYSSSH